MIATTITTSSSLHLPSHSYHLHVHRLKRRPSQSTAGRTYLCINHESPSHYAAPGLSSLPSTKTIASRTQITIQTIPTRRFIRSFTLIATIRNLRGEGKKKERKRSRDFHSVGIKQGYRNRLDTFHPTLKHPSDQKDKKRPVGISTNFPDRIATNVSETNQSSILSLGLAPTKLFGELSIASNPKDRVCRQFCHSRLMPVRTKLYSPQFRSLTSKRETHFRSGFLHQTQIKTCRV